MRRLLFAAVLLSACSAGTSAPPDLSARLPAHRARAGVVAKDADLIGGPTAVGRKGDFKLYNSLVQVIVQQPGPSSGYDTYGGLVVDADVVRAPGQGGHSRFGEAIPVYDFRTPRGVSAEVVRDGHDGGAAEVKVHAVDDAFPLVEAVLGQNRPDMHLAIDIDYVLEPDSRALKIITTLKNTGSDTLHVSDHYVGYVMGDGLQQFLPGPGFDIPQLPPPAPYYAAIADDVSYSFFSPDSEFTPLIQFQGFLLGALGKFDLDPGVANSVEMDLVIGDGDLATHEAVHRQLATAAQLEVPEVHAISGKVADPHGNAVSRARVHVVDVEAKRDLLVTRTKADGSFSVALPDGRYELTAIGDGRDAGAAQTVSVAGADLTNVAVPVGGTGSLQLGITSGGHPVPAKIQLVRTHVPDAPSPMFGEAPRFHGFERIEFLLPGTQVLALPPGEWQVLASRGFEYELAQKTVTVNEGAVTSVALDLPRAIDTTGWLSGDYHVHAQWSPDSDDLLEKKVRAFAAEGLEVPVSTEHEYIGDFNPTIERLALSEWVHGLVGEEVSTTPIGHFNAFPLLQQPGVANFGAIAWYGIKGDDLMKAMRAMPGKPLVQVNHPRSGTFGAPIIKGYFTAVGFDPATFSVRAERDWTTDYDSLEIANGSAPTYDDWFAFLDRGRRMLATGDSDSHRAEDDVVGYPRNFVEAGTDAPQDLKVDGYMAQLRAGRLSVSGGYFLQLQSGTHELGDLVPVSELGADGLALQVKVQAASWVPDGTLEIVVNGQVAVTKPLENKGGGVRFADTVHVPVDTSADSWVFARVVSEGRLAPVYPGSDAFAFTNPIYVDANGNGVFDARVK